MNTDPSTWCDFFCQIIFTFSFLFSGLRTQWSLWAHVCWWKERITQISFIHMIAVRQTLMYVWIFLFVWRVEQQLTTERHLLVKTNMTSWHLFWAVEFEGKRTKTLNVILIWTLKYRQLLVCQKEHAYYTFTMINHSSFSCITVYMVTLLVYTYFL